MSDSVSFEHDSAHSADAVWGVLGKFTQIDWMVGEGNYSTAEHDGREARVLKMATPIVEYLIACDDDKRKLSYGVVKNAFVPVDNYTATVRVTALTAGCRVSFQAEFDLDEVPLDQVRQMLTGAYQMMANQIDAKLGG